MSVREIPEKAESNFRWLTPQLTSDVCVGSKACNISLHKFSLIDSGLRNTVAICGQLKSHFFHCHWQRQRCKSEGLAVRNCHYGNYRGISIAIFYTYRYVECQGKTCDRKLSWTGKWLGGELGNSEGMM